MPDLLNLDPLPDAPFTDRALTRLALGAAAREASDYARGLVPTGPDRATSPADRGVLVEDAARLVAYAKDVLACAVLVERAAGASWDDVGAALEITRQSAHGRFAATEADWETAVAAWRRTGDPRTPGLRDGAEDPESWARRLDQWVVRHRDHDDLREGETPVSDGLPRMSPWSELLHLDGVRRALLAEHFVPPPADLLPIAERQAVLNDTLAAAGGDLADEHRAVAQRCREQAQQLRAHLAEEGAAS